MIRTFCHLQFLSLLESKKISVPLKFPLISDLTENIINKYSIVTKNGICFPTIFIIDKAGIIQYYNINNPLCGRNVNEIFKVLKSIQYLKEIPKKSSLTKRRRYIRKRIYIPNYRSIHKQFRFRSYFQ